MSDPFKDPLVDYDGAETTKRQLQAQGLATNKQWSEVVLFPDGDHRLRIKHSLGVVPKVVTVMPLKRKQMYFTNWCLYENPTGEFAYVEASGRGYALVYIGG